MAHAVGSCVWGAASVASGLMCPMVANFFWTRGTVRGVVPSLGARTGADYGDSGKTVVFTKRIF